MPEQAGAMTMAWRKTWSLSSRDDAIEALGDVDEAGTGPFFHARPPMQRSADDRREPPTTDGAASTDGGRHERRDRHDRWRRQ